MSFVIDSNEQLQRMSFMANVWEQSYPSQSYETMNDIIIALSLGEGGYGHSGTETGATSFHYYDSNEVLHAFVFENEFFCHMVWMANNLMGGLRRVRCRADMRVRLTSNYKQTRSNK